MAIRSIAALSSQLSVPSSQGLSLLQAGSRRTMGSGLFLNSNAGLVIALRVQWRIAKNTAALKERALGLSLFHADTQDGWSLGPPTTPSAGEWVAGALHRAWPRGCDPG